MSIELRPGPIRLVDIGAALSRERGDSIEEFVAARVGDIDGVDARIEANIRLMADDLDGDAEIDPFGELDEAAAEHARQTGEPDPNFAHDVAVARSGNEALARLASELPPDDTPPLEATVDFGGDGFEGIDVDYDAIGRPVPATPPPPAAPPGTSAPPGTGGGGTPPEPGSVDKPPSGTPGGEPLPLPEPGDVDTGGGIKLPGDDADSSPGRVFQLPDVRTEKING